MIVSYDNRLKEATLSATNEDINRPITNVIHNFLELAFFSETTSSEITIVFDETESLDHIAFDYHNLDSMVIEFYDIFDNLLHTETITVIEDCNFHIWNTIDNVKTVVITAETYASEMYIGGISMGEYFEFPYFTQSIKGEIKLGSTLSISAGGQASGNSKKNLESYSLNFSYLDNNVVNDIKYYLDFINKIPHFVNFYEDANDYFKPFYGVITTGKIPKPKRRLSTWNWDFSLTYQEVR